ncbi:trace amine-associated receptor 13c-like [Amia ocellicauda]|uniref:trace amine-associated receptor 13c-like n=1 Tax=Amia ocellicauda TaxID=2972642 RepID=UPI003463CAFC
MYFVFVLTVLITVGGNLVVVISISHFKQLHSPNNLLVLSLAMVDFLLGLFVLPFSMIRMVETCWYMGSFYCKLHIYFEILFGNTSVFHLCFIAIDRYYAVCKPLRYANKINIRVSWIFVSLAWVLGALYCFAMNYYISSDKHVQELVEQLSCEGNCLFVTNKVWDYMDKITFFVPCFVMIGIYARIYTVARNQARLIKIMEDRTFTLENSRRRAQRNREQKAAKTLGIVMGVFIGCYLPFYIVIILYQYFNIMIPGKVFDAFICLAYINSTFNPLIYAFFYPWFQKALKLIVTLKIYHPNSSRTKLYGNCFSCGSCARGAAPVVRRYRQPRYAPGSREVITRSSTHGPSCCFWTSLKS